MKHLYSSILMGIVFFFASSSKSLFSQKLPALSVLKNYVYQNKERLGVTDKDVENLFVTYDYTDEATGIQHIYSTQKLNGLTIAGSNFALHVYDTKQAASNRLIALSKYNVLSPNVSINPSDAVKTLMDVIAYTDNKNFEIKQPSTGADKYTIFKRSNSSVWDIPCRLVYYNNERLKTLTPAWEIQMMDVYKKHYWLAYVNAATGTILEKKDLIIHCDFGGGVTDADNRRITPVLKISENNNAHFQIQEQTNQPFQQESTASLPNNQYRVYNIPFENPIDPGSAHSLVTKGGDVLSSPDGWHKVSNLITYNYARGNNVWAFQDPSPGPLGGVPSADPTRTAYPTNTTAGVPPLLEPFVFDYPVNLNNEPETYMKAAIVNLFFWNNLMHDVFYYMGFDEASGNFQESNTFSTGTRGGNTALANDAVLAQAQDGGGTNNANFLTLPDGTNGQMQMYLWTASSPDSLVQITSSTSGIPSAGKKFMAIQGSLSTSPLANNNLYTNPVLNKELAIIQKNALSTVGTESEGCSTAQQSIALPANNVNGKIAVIDRGNCTFVEKVLGAQEGGAAGAIIVNNVDGPPIVMGGSDATGNAISIPAVMISKADGEILKTQLSSGATIIGSLKRNSPPAPKRDGDLDNGVISHEYGHGISNRLTGGPGSLFPLGGDEQGGEGWSDFVALYMTLRNNDLAPATTQHPFGALPSRGIGNYVTYQAYNGPGIREFPYSINMNINPVTFAYIKRSDYSETHSVGFVWCTMLYELLQTFIDQYGINDNVYEGANSTTSHNPPATAKGNNIATRLVIEAMKLQPVNPTFVEERDAILKADTLLYNGQHSCAIW
ncbi:MAG TPA: M36 family metallopeptidase, partial [Chitinophagaceae bacterium]|nr:M36 family metallopeptidase [Chitinophagaceae bacterium]